MPSEEIFQGRHVPLADFAEHPADRLVHQVFTVGPERFRDLERVVKVPEPDEMECRQDANPAIPEPGRFGKPVERPAAFVRKIGPNDLRGRKVHQVPVVDELRIGEVEVVDSVVPNLANCYR